MRSTIAGQRGARPTAAAARGALRWIASDPRDAPVERRGERVVHRRRVVAFDEDGVVAVALEQRIDLVVVGPAEHGRPGDLVPVEVQDRQHRAVARRVEEAMPFHEPSSGPVSASPSPTTHATSRSGLSNAAPKAWAST